MSDETGPKGECSVREELLIRPPTRESHKYEGRGIKQKLVKTAIFHLMNRGIYYVMNFYRFDDEIVRPYIRSVVINLDTKIYLLNFD